MHAGRFHTGYTLVELLVIVAVIGLLAGIAVPMYRSHASAAEAARILHHYDYAVRVSREVLVNDRTRRSLDQPSHLPRSTAAWVDHLNGRQGAAAVGSVPFVAGTSGNADRGAIGVLFDAKTESVSLAQPAYRGLTTKHALVTVDGVTFTTP